MSAAAARSCRARGPRGDDAISYFSRVADCRDCPLQIQVLSKLAEPEAATCTRQRAMSPGLSKTPAYDQTRRDRKKVEMLFAHLKRILRFDRLRLRGPAGARFEFTLAAIAQNLRRFAKLALHPPNTAALCVA
ncbi:MULTISPECIES: transposase [Bradyrhizobium]|nr:MULTISPECIES: transposase [Bradyrhizobium]